MLMAFTAPASPSVAQDRDVSLRLGLSATTFSGEGDFDPLINLAGALSVRQRFGAIFLQTEAQVTTRGASIAFDEPYPRLPGSDNRPYSRLRTDITYIDVPLFVGAALPGSIQPLVYAGPYGGIRFEARNRFTYGDTGLTTTRDARDVALIDYGIAAGVGVEVATRFYRLLIDLRAAAGLAPVFDDLDDQRHRMLTLTSGIIF